MTKELFREDGYLKTCESMVTEVQGNGFAVDQTVFYPMGGGQPGDVGEFKVGNNPPLPIPKESCRKSFMANRHLVA